MSYGGYGSRAPPPSGGYSAPPGPPPGYGGTQGYGGGFAPPGRGPPPGADPQLWQWFQTVDIDGSGAISAQELQRALINGDWSPFDLDTVKLLMTMFDADRSGTIGFNEFTGLWNYIKQWQQVFKHFDRDRSGGIDSGELQAALGRFGYNLSPRLIDLVQKKYDVKGSQPAPIGFADPGISFDRFVRACVVIKQLSDAFVKIDTDKDGWIHINYEQFMETVLSLP